MKKNIFSLIGALIRLAITIACWIFVIKSKELSMKQVVIIILVYVEIATLDLVYTPAITNTKTVNHKYRKQLHNTQ